MRNFLFAMALIFCVPLAACGQRAPIQTDSTPAPEQVIVQSRAPYIVNVIDTVSVRPYTPPAIYAKWWAEISACVKLPISRATTKSVRYLYVKGDAFVINGVPMAFDGYSFIRDNQMMVIYNGVVSEGLIKHEMIHFLMYHNGIEAGHPDKYFKVKGCKNYFNP